MTTFVPVLVTCSCLCIFFSNLCLITRRTWMSSGVTGPPVSGGHILGTAETAETAETPDTRKERMKMTMKAGVDKVKAKGRLKHLASVFLTLVAIVPLLVVII